MIICTKCGQVADTGETFCRSCNAFLEWFGEPTKTAAAPPAVSPAAVPARRADTGREAVARPIAMTLGAGSVRVEPGGQASTTVEVHNRGHTVDQLTLEILGPAATWSSADPPRVNLMPGTSAVVTIVFRPPRTSTVRAGPTPVDVAVRSYEHPDTWLVERVVVEVAAFADLETVLVPSVLQGVDGAATRMRSMNNGNASVELSLTADDPQAAFGFRISPSTLRVDPGATAAASVEIRPREALPSGPDRTRPFRVLVALGDGSRRALDGTFTQVAEPEEAGPPILATLARDALRVEPGGQVGVAVELLNRGPTVDQISLEVGGPAAAWATVDPARLNVMPDRSAAASILFHPPRTPGMAPGPYLADVVIRSREHPDALVVDHVVAEVLPFEDIETSLTPSVLHGGREATATIGILNRGNTPIRLSLGGEDPEMAFVFRISPSSLGLNPGRAANAKLRVRPRRRPRSSMDQTRPFRVLLTVGGGSRRALDGTFVQAAARRRRFPCLLRLLVLLLVLALIGVGSYAALDTIGFWEVGLQRLLNPPAVQVVPNQPPQIVGLDPPHDIDESERLSMRGSEQGIPYTEVHLAVEVREPGDGHVIETIRWETDQTDLPGGTVLGQGPEITARLYSPCCQCRTVHIITVYVTDSGGDTATAVRRIALGTIC